MGDEAERIGRTEALFRDVNERIAERAQDFGLGGTEFLCECADATCTTRLNVELDAYERVREHATHFLLAPGHELPAKVERIVHHEGRYQVVRKVHEVVAAVVRRLDPRAEPA